MVAKEARLEAELKFHDLESQKTASLKRSYRQISPTAMQDRKIENSQTLSQ